MRYQLILHQDLRAHIDHLHEERKRDPGGDAAKEYVAVIKGLKALQEGRESEYHGKQLGYGPRSYDLRDCAELKVPVFEEFKTNGWPMGPSHRLTYREFDPLPKVEGNRVVTDPNAMPYRHVVAFEHRANDPAAVTGERLRRQRGFPVRDLQGLTGGGRPSIGPQQPGVQTTPHRMPVPPDLVRQAAILRDSPLAGSRGTPRTGQGEAPPRRPPEAGRSQPRER
jgi:hypothetical protein